MNDDLTPEERRDIAAWEAEREAEARAEMVAEAEMEAAEREAEVSADQRALEGASRGVRAEKDRYMKLVNLRQQARDVVEQLEEQWFAPNGGVPELDRADLDRARRDLEQLNVDVEQQQRRVRAAQQRERGLEL